MSNNKQDEPDDYDAIFDSSNADSDKDVAIEVTDGDTIQPQEYVDAEPGFIDAEVADYTDSSKDTLDADFPVKDDTESEDTDIEEGIFAPTRKERPATKKSTSLMWAVSLLAFVGVGSFVYVTNPDILSKMTQNMDSDAVTVPNNFGIEEPADHQAAAADVDAAKAETAAPIPEGEAPITPVAENTMAATDIIQPDIAPTDDTDETVAVTSDTPPVPSEPPADQPVDMTANVTTSVATSEPIIPPSAETPTPLLGGEEPTGVITGEIKTLEDATEAAKIAAVTEAAKINPPTADNFVVPVPETEGKQAEMASAPIDKTAEGPVAGVVTPPLNDANGADTQNAPVTPDVIAPTNDVYEDAVEANAAATATVAAPEPEVVAAQKAAAEAAAKQKKEAAAASVAEAGKPIVVNSAEEQKRLNDANLDQYFDSPGGSILTMIPAPSMDAKKGSNESIIIVNKKGSKAEKTKTSAPASSRNVKIETTTLDTQLISANRALKLGRYEAAKDMYDELYKLNPRDPQILSGRAVLLQKMGFADQAINAYEELLKLYPDNADAIVNWSGLVRKQYPAAALSKLLDLHIAQPQNALVTAQLGVANADAGNFGDALRYLNDAATMEPKNPLHFYNLAVISEKAGQRPQAVGYYEKALEVDAIYGEGKNSVPREKIYDRLAQIRGN